MAVVPVIVLSARFGLNALGLGLTDHGGAAAFFGVLLATEPAWLVLVVVALAVLLVMTSADTLLSGLASLALHDLPRIVDADESGPGDHGEDALRAVRILTGVVRAGGVDLGVGTESGRETPSQRLPFS